MSHLEVIQTIRQLNKSSRPCPSFVFYQRADYVIEQNIFIREVGAEWWYCSDPRSGQRFIVLPRHKEKLLGATRGFGCDELVLHGIRELAFSNIMKIFQFYKALDQ